MRVLRMSPIVLVLGLVVACATAPKSPSGRQELMTAANETLTEMTRRDPGLRNVLQQSAGFAVFPSIGKGGLVIGGAHGRGVLYQAGRPIGWVQLSQASLGALAGGQTFSQLIVFRTPQALQDIKDGEFTLSGDVSAVALTAGAAAQARFRHGTAVFILPRGGLMAEVAVSGQKISFTPEAG
jgi:lipid-binding SYLF domain-containing protein